MTQFLLLKEENWNNFLKFLPKQFLMVLSSINLINTPQTNLY